MNIKTIINPELKNLKITVSPTQQEIRLKFRSLEEKEKYFDRLLSFANKAMELKHELTLRSRYRPEKDDDNNYLLFCTWGKKRKCFGIRI